MSFEQSEILELSPLGVVICDLEQRIIFCNRRFITDTAFKQEDVVGHLFASLPLEAIDKRAHVVQLFDVSLDNPKKFSYWQANISDPKGAIAHYFVLQREPAHININANVDTKIPKRANWIEFLDYEVSRSRRYDNPLSLLKVHVITNSSSINIDNDEISQRINDTLMDELRWADMIGNTSHGSYLMVLPETPSSALDHLETKLSDAITDRLKDLSSSLSCQIVFGSAHWQKHDDSLSLLKRARENLVEALEAL